MHFVDIHSHVTGILCVTTAYAAQLEQSLISSGLRQYYTEYKHHFTRVHLQYNANQVSYLIVYAVMTAFVDF